jgi:hypothetical protein
MQQPPGPRLKLGTCGPEPGTRPAGLHRTIAASAFRNRAARAVRDLTPGPKLKPRQQERQRSPDIGRTGDSALEVVGRQSAKANPSFRRWKQATSDDSTSGPVRTRCEDAALSIQARTHRRLAAFHILAAYCPHLSPQPPLSTAPPNGYFYTQEVRGTIDVSCAR